MIETPRARPSPGKRHPARQRAPGFREGWATASVIAAAALATFLALLVTSRPFDPMDSTLEPQRDVPSSALALQPSPKPSVSPSITPAQAAATPPAPGEPAGETKAPVTDDAAIQAEIERRIAGDATLSSLAVSIMVEGGRVTIFGTVSSPELKTRAERIVRSNKGVIAIDNQLVVTEPSP